MQSTNGTQIFVANLPWASTEDDLRNLFEENGVEVISARIMKSKDTGRSAGFGFVTVGSGDIDDIVNEMKGIDMDGRPLIVERAKGVQHLGKSTSRAYAGSR